MLDISDWVTFEFIILGKFSIRKLEDMEDLWRTNLIKPLLKIAEAEVV